MYLLTFQRRRENIFIGDHLDPISSGLLVNKRTTYADIIQRLVRRYLFRLDRDKHENDQKVETIETCKLRTVLKYKLPVGYKYYIDLNVLGIIIHLLGSEYKSPALGILIFLRSHLTKHQV